MTVLFLGGVTAFSVAVSLPRLMAGGRGDLDLGDIGGVKEDAFGGDGSGGGGGGVSFFRELRRSRLGTRLQVG